MQVAVTEGEEQYVEAVDELHEDGYNNGQSGDGMPPEAEDGRNEPHPEDAAGADVHYEQVAGNSQVADRSGHLAASILGLVEASATQTVGNPVPAVPLPAQLLYVSGAHAPMVDATTGVWSWLPDPSELYALPRMPYPHMGHSTLAAGRMMPAPITAVVQTTVTTTITSTVAASAAQARLVYTSFTGPGAPISGMYAIRPMYRAADHQYHVGSTFVDPKGVGALTPDKSKSEPSVEFLLEPLGIRNPAGVQSRVALVRGLARCCIARRSPGRPRSSSEGGQDHRVLWVRGCTHRRYACRPGHGQQMRQLDRSDSSYQISRVWWAFRADCYRRQTRRHRNGQNHRQQRRHCQSDTVRLGGRRTS